MMENIDEMNASEEEKKQEALSEKHILMTEAKTIKQGIHHFDNTLQYILDPLSVIIKLAILSYKPENSKLSIHNNILYIQEPGFFQSIVRYYFNDNKNDLHYLYNPLELACSSFLNKKYENLDLTPLFVTAQKGLDKLIKNYKDARIIVHTLFMYHNLISNYIGSNYNKDLFMKDTITPLYNDTIVKSLNSKWSYDKIKVLLNMFEFVEKDDNKSSIKCLDEFMVHIDNDTHSYIIFINS
jgi:hypothetical protein